MVICAAGHRFDRLPGYSGRAFCKECDDYVYVRVLTEEETTTAFPKSTYIFDWSQDASEE